jgi:hypothetical protein
VSRRLLGKTFFGALVLATAILTVGLTASSDGMFSIVVRPVLARLGFDLDVKIGTMHLHASWSAFDITALTTKPGPSEF